MIYRVLVPVVDWWPMRPTHPPRAASRLTLPSDAPVTAGRRYGTA